MTTSQTHFTLDRPAALIAALPAILGFVPENSLILVSVDGGELGSVLRVDLSDELDSVVGRLAEVAAAAAPAASIAVIVDETGARCPACKDEYRRLIEALTEALARHRVALLGAHLVDRVALGGRWRCVDDCGLGGPVDDPEASPLAAAAVLAGRRLYGRREDLHAVIIPDDSARSAAVAAAIAAGLAQRSRSSLSDTRHRYRRDIEGVLAVIDGIAAGKEPADTDLAKLGCVLSDMRVRDTLCALAIGEQSGDAETLWSLLARTLPTPWRAEALALLAFSAYARGDGPLAGVALEAALRCAPGHRMAGLLDTALQSGLRPERVRGLAETGYRLAQQWGVQLPPRQGADQRAG